MARMIQIARGLTLAALTLAAPMVIAQQKYRVVPTPCCVRDPVSIDAHGRIFGVGTDVRRFICTAAACHELPRYLRDRAMNWTAVNDQHVRTGYSARNGSSWALRKDPQQNGSLFLTHGAGLAIAPDGAVVGTHDDRPFLYTDHLIKMRGLAFETGEPTAINSLHVIVGRSDAADGKEHATLWAAGGGAAEDLGLCAGHRYSWALALNEAGTAVGMCYDDYVVFYPARFEGGLVQRLRLPNDGDSGRALGINDSGIIVGRIVQPSLGRTVGGIAEGDRMVDLNLRLRRADANRYFISDAVGVNEAGQIAAQAIDSQDGRTKAVRLEPVD